MIWNYITYQLAGLWPLLLSYGLGTALIVCCLAAAYFSPIGKKDFLYAAGIIAIVMVTFTVGVTQGEKRVHAQWDAARAAAVDNGKKARAGAIRDVARKPSRWLPNKRDPDLRD